MVMDERFLKDYEKQLKWLFNSVEIKPTREDINIISIPVNDIAQEIGNAKTTNMVALDAAMKYLDFVALDDVKAELKSIFTGRKEINTNK